MQKTIISCPTISTEPDVSVNLTRQEALDVIYYLKAYRGKTQGRTDTLDLAEKFRKVFG